MSPAEQKHIIALVSFMAACVGLIAILSGDVFGFLKYYPHPMPVREGGTSITTGLRVDQQFANTASRYFERSAEDFRLLAKHVEWLQRVVELTIGVFTFFFLITWSFILSLSTSIDTLKEDCEGEEKD